MRNYTAQMYGTKTGGYLIAARSKSGLIQKAKAEARKEANEGGILKRPDGHIFGEILVDGAGTVHYVKRKYWY